MSILQCAIALVNFISVVHFPIRVARPLAHCGVKNPLRAAPAPARLGRRSALSCRPKSFSHPTQSAIAAQSRAERNGIRFTPALLRVHALKPNVLI
jgi:hypothetical protein